MTVGRLLFKREESAMSIEVERTQTTLRVGSGSGENGCFYAADEGCRRRLALAFQ